MSLDSRTLTIIAAMALAAAFCRFAGFWFMRFVPVTPRVKAALDAMPLAVMIGIILPPVLRGGVPELAGLVVTCVAQVSRGNELVSIVAGMATVAIARASGL